MAAQDAFSLGVENYDKPLALLEQCFIAAGRPIEFIGELRGTEKIVCIYWGGLLHRRASIDGDNPAAAVKDVAKLV